MNRLSDFAPSAGYFRITTTQGGVNSLLFSISQGQYNVGGMYAIMLNVSNTLLRNVFKNDLIAHRELELYQKHISADAYEIAVPVVMYERVDVIGSTRAPLLEFFTDITGYTKVTFS